MSEKDKHQTTRCGQFWCCQPGSQLENFRRWYVTRESELFCCADIDLCCWLAGNGRRSRMKLYRSSSSSNRCVNFTSELWRRRQNRRTTMSPIFIATKKISRYPVFTQRWHRVLFISLDKPHLGRDNQEAYSLRPAVVIVCRYPTLPRIYTLTLHRKNK